MELLEIRKNAFPALNTSLSLSHYENKKSEEIRTLIENLQGLNDYFFELLRTRANNAEKIVECRAVVADLNKMRDTLNKEFELSEKILELENSILDKEFALNERVTNNDNIMSWNSFFDREAYNEKHDKIQALISQYEGKIDGLIKQNVEIINDYNEFKLALKNKIQEEDPKLEYQCTICFKDRVKYCMAPCGHTFCGSCSQKMIHSCFICRGNVLTKIRMYLPEEDGDSEINPRSNGTPTYVPGITNPIF